MLLVLSHLLLKQQFDVARQMMDALTSAGG
jgi:hypothetical protein